MWHWLVTQGLYKDLLAFALGMLWAKAMRLGKTLRQILDRLDTHTPGGLGDFVDQEDVADEQHPHHKDEMPNPGLPKFLRHK